MTEQRQTTRCFAPIRISASSSSSSSSPTISSSRSPPVSPFLMDAGAPLIRAGERQSEASASPAPTSSQQQHAAATSSSLLRSSDASPFPLPGEYRPSSISPPDRIRVELSDMHNNQNGSSGDVDIFAPPSLSASSSSSSSSYPLAASSSSSSHGPLARRGSGAGANLRVRLGGSNADSHNQPLLSPSMSDPNEERLHPLLSPFGSPIPSDVILDMVAHLPPAEKATWIAARWADAQPDDVFVHAFSFLTPAELAHVSSVNRSWSHSAYEPSLWTHMDLSQLYTRVDDAFITHLLGSMRFIQLQTLILEGCSAITNKSIKSILYFCPNLREIRLTDCNHITNPWVFIELVKALPFLRKLELYGVTKEFAIVTPMLAIRPKLDLGLFWREYCAENGMKLDGTGIADCRYDEAADGDAVRAPQAGGNGQRGCWGRVKGRIVYANDFYHRGGNYPFSVLYSCANHIEQDFTDPEYHRCHVCENLFSVTGESMWTPMICRVCFDKSNLLNKQNWIPLDASNVKAFGISEVVAKTIHVASRKNLPVSLRSFGSTPARVDYNIPVPVDEEAGEGNAAGGAGGNAHGFDNEQENNAEEQKALLPARVPVDLNDVPLSTFVGVNAWRLDETVHTLRGKLMDATKNLNTRALLVYDSNENIEVLADKRVILDGREGEEHMELTVQAWHQALEILYPIVIVMILVLHFNVLFVKQTIQTYDGTSNYSVYIRQPSDNSMSATLVLIIALITFILLVIIIILVYKFREQCERCFKRFLVADILLIFMFGVATFIWLLVAEWRIYLDTLTFIGIIWNLSMIGLISLYYPMPERLHHFFLILLNSIMGMMMVATLGRWLVLTFLLVFSLGDIISELRPQMRFLSPFIIPTGVELIYNTPKILYTVGGLRLRAADLMCFGMLTGLGLATGNSTADYSTVLLGGSIVFVCVMSSMATMLFVAPFIGCRFRPMPLAVISAFVLTMMQESVLMPFLMQQNNLTVSPIQFQ